MDHLGFGEALQRLRAGCLLARPGWRDTRYILLIQSRRFHVIDGSPIGQAAPVLVGKSIELHAHLYAHCRDGTFMVWRPTDDDLLAGDWKVVEC